MPNWSSIDAPRHTKLADTMFRRQMWAKIANESYDYNIKIRGDSSAEAEARAIRVANAKIREHHRDFMHHHRRCRFI